MRTINFYFECTRCGGEWVRAREVTFFNTPEAEDADCEHCDGEGTGDVVLVEEVPE